MGRMVRAQESRAEMVLGRGVPEPLHVVANIEASSFVNLNLNLNLNNLLVKRQIDNPSPGAVTGGN